MQQIQPTAAAHTDQADVATRVRAIRSRLPGQVLVERIEVARATYGPLYSVTEARRRVAETLPRQFGLQRGAALEPIEEYRSRIPDEALLKYDDAVQSGLFSRLMVAIPTYYRERQVDPWILGQVAGTEEWAVIAQWE